LRSLPARAPQFLGRPALSFLLWGSP